MMDLDLNVNVNGKMGKMSNMIKYTVLADNKNIF